MAIATVHAATLQSPPLSVDPDTEDVRCLIANVGTKDISDYTITILNPENVAIESVSGTSLVPGSFRYAEGEEAGPTSYRCEVEFKGSKKSLKATICITPLGVMNLGASCRSALSF